MALALAVVAAGAGITWLTVERDAVFTEWYSLACLVDANGDDVLDLAGQSGRPGGEHWNLTVVDGNDGEVLWRSDSSSSPEDSVMCLGKDAFGVAFPDARISVLDPRSRTEKWSMPLSDKASSYGVGDDCVRIQSIDQKEVSVALSDGKPRECKAPLETIGATAPGYQSTSEASSVDLDSGDTTYRLQAKEGGTAFLTVSAHRGDETLWETRLRYAAVDGGLYFADAPQMLLVYGVDPGQDDTGVIVGIDRESGRVRYEAAQGPRWSVHFVRTFAFDGRYLVTTWGYGLQAFDPVTGKKVWHIGGR